MLAEPYKNLDFGTKPSTASLEDVVITVDGGMIADYSQAYIREAFRVNPLKAEQLQLTEEELSSYFKGLLSIRIQSLQPGGCKDWRVAKQLTIPSFYQFVLSTIGIVTDHIHGLRFIPEFNADYDIQAMLDTSNKVESLMLDGLTASKDAMPRGIEGDKDVMSFVILGSYVYGRCEDHSPIAAYVAAFLGFKLQEEATFKMLYRVRYEDISFIRDSLTHERSIICKVG